MYIMTYHSTLLATVVIDNILTQLRSWPPSGGQRLVDIDPTEVAKLEAAQPISGERGVAITGGPLAGYAYVKSATPGSFHLFKGGFVCAPPNQTAVICDRKAALQWETFKFIAPEAAAACLQGDGQREEALEARVRSLIDQRIPVCLHFGCGYRRIPGYLNIDKHAHARRPGRSSEDYFVFNFTGKSWPIPDSSVDYIYSEDFIEHIPQRTQVAFLAESFRVLKKDSYHRVNTPCLAESMKTHSECSKGYMGVYFGEFDKWGHVALFTRGFISDLARAIGYRQVFFTAKSRGSSPYAVEDQRPQNDRDEKTGNILADLLK
jgi:hypothetical protein